MVVADMWLVKIKSDQILERSASIAETWTLTIMMGDGQTVFSSCGINKLFTVPHLVFWCLYLRCE